jgi:hypothetical protein
VAVVDGAGTAAGVSVLVAAGSVVVVVVAFFFLEKKDLSLSKGDSARVDCELGRRWGKVP